MDNIFSELKRRHIYRVAAAYAVVAWVLLQIVNNIAPGLNLPNSAVTLVIVLLAAASRLHSCSPGRLNSRRPLKTKQRAKRRSRNWILLS